MDTKKLKVRSYRSSDEGQVIDLWERCDLIVPHNDPKRDIQRKMTVQSELFLLGLIDEVVIAALMAGYDGHRGWINYLAVAPQYQRKGIGRRMMAEAEARLRELGCPKIDLQVRTSNTGVIEFYNSIGFSLDDVVSMGKRLAEDS